MTVVHSDYLALIRLVIKQRVQSTQSYKSHQHFGQSSSIENLVVEIFQDHCETGLYTLKVYIPHHLTEDLGRLESMKMLDASPFKRYDVLINLYYRQTSRCLSSSMAEMVQLMNQDMNNTVTADNVRVST